MTKHVIRAVRVELFILLDYSIECLIEYSNTDCYRIYCKRQMSTITETALYHRKLGSLNLMVVSEFCSRCACAEKIWQKSLKVL